MAVKLAMYISLSNTCTEAKTREWQDGWKTRRISQCMCSDDITEGRTRVGNTAENFSISVT